MADAIVKANTALETLEGLPAPIDKPDDQKTPGELLNEGLHAGLILGRDACRYAIRHMETIEKAGVLIYGEDLKVLRWGTDTAGWLTRAGIRIAEGEFRAKRDDVLAQLLAQIASAKGETQK